MTIKLQPLNSQSPYLDDAIAVYNEYVPGDVRYHAHFFKTHMQRQDYIGFVAQWQQRIVGFAFGSRAMRGQWWREKVAWEIGDKHPALENAWILTQLNVLKDFRGQGIGGLLHDTLVKQQPCPQMLLSTQVSNKGAQRFYFKRGWTVLHKGFAFATGVEPYMVLQLHVQDAE
jgi:ribosomal protein S18 acetylase RimI-like enzyme